MPLALMKRSVYLAAEHMPDFRLEVETLFCVCLVLSSETGRPLVLSLDMLSTDPFRPNSKTRIRS